MSSPVVSSRTPIGQIINGDGTATFAFLKWMQNVGTTVNVSFDSEGNYQGAIGDQATIDGRETLASIVQNISTDGVVQGPGIDFALPYLNKDTDHIADGTGSPLAGGKAAYKALVASSPVAGQTIRFNGTDWLPVAIAVSKVLAVSQWLRSYDAATGTFTASQPVFTDIAGQISDVLVLTTTGTSGASTLVGNTLNVPVYTAPAQVYPGVGIGVSTGSAWAASIDPATVPRLNTANTFTANQTITGSVQSAGLSTISTAGQTTGCGNFGWTGDKVYIDSFGSTATPGTIRFRQFGAGAVGGIVSLDFDTSGNATFSGTITAAGKSFKITHPLDETKDLYHSCLEGPEWGVYYRGRAKTDAMGSVTIFLPDYFEALVSIEERTVLLTVINDGSDKFPLLKSSEVSAGGFTVRSSIPETEFYWEVKAIRRIGVDRLEVVRDKSDD